MLIGWFICVLTRLKLWMNVYEILGWVGLGERISLLDFGANLHSNLAPGILFIFRFFFAYLQCVK